MRLIDADALIKNLSYLYTKNHIPVDMRSKEILTTIMEQPTAYDVDKVAGELKIIKEDALAEYNIGEYNLDNNIGNSIAENYRKDMNEGKCLAYDEAIEIVKQGGVSDDICEWKQDNMCETVYRVCGGFSTTAYQTDFEFCPYCGRRIKIVGD